MRTAIILILLIVTAVTVAAQETWETTYNCMGDLSYPIIRRGNWDFPGVIVSTDFREGVRGARGDQNVEYYIALESEHAFPAVGVVSPDGRYFAYPIGTTSHNVNFGGDDFLSVDFLRIVRTDGVTDETYRFDTNNNAYSGALRSLKLPSPTWFGPDNVYYPNKGASTTRLINFQSGEITDWTLSVRPDAIGYVSPDGTRGFSGTLYDLENDENLEYPASGRIFWFADSSAFLALDETGVSIVDRDGNINETIDLHDIASMVLAPNGEAFAFWDSEQNLFVADINQRVIYDLCFQTQPIVSYYLYYYTNLAWSPDSRSLAFTYDNYVVILDTQTFENQILDQRTQLVMAWVPLEGETAEPSDAGIRPPQATPTSAPTPTPSPTLEASATFAPPTATPQVGTCQLEVIAGANLRAGAGVDFEKVGSADVGFVLTADAQQFNSAEFFHWWRLTTGEWIREDFTRESAECEFLPDLENP